jgi:hypothetical protein
MVYTTMTKTPSTIPWEGWKSGASFLNKDNGQLKNVFEVEFKFWFSSFWNSVHLHHKWFKRCTEGAAELKKCTKFFYSSFPTVMMTTFSPSWPLVTANFSFNCANFSTKRNYTVQCKGLKVCIIYIWIITNLELFYGYI